MKKFVFAGSFDGDESKLPHAEHHAEAVAFKELDMKSFAVLANIGAILLSAALIFLVVLHGREYFAANKSAMPAAAVFSVLSLIPHEFLHGLCFRETVYMYTNLKRGMLFVVGTESMSKSRFIWMSLCPNLIFGFLPLLIGLVYPSVFAVGVFGALCIGMGFGDYINVFNAAVQMPKGAKTYLYGFHSYWYKN